MNELCHSKKKNITLITIYDKVFPFGSKAKNPKPILGNFSSGVTEENVDVMVEELIRFFLLSIPYWDPHLGKCS